MKPLIVLLAVFSVSCLASFIFPETPDFHFCGRLAMSVMLLFTSIAHFKFNKGMVMMMPDYIPFKKPVVYLTGYMEIIAAIGLLVNQLRIPTAWIVIVFFILLLPANIFAAKNKVNLEQADYSGSGMRYLWFRIPLQFFFIAWIYFFGVVN